MRSCTRSDRTHRGVATGPERGPVLFWLVLLAAQQELSLQAHLLEPSHGWRAEPLMQALCHLFLPPNCFPSNHQPTRCYDLVNNSN